MDTTITSTKAKAYTRILFKFETDKISPTVVFFAGIHGNEKAGVAALNHVNRHIGKHVLKGNVYGILGNLKALEDNQRYVDQDLNRLWTEDSIKEVLAKRSLNTEEEQLKLLFSEIQHVLKTYKGPIYFIDLHTTSSQTLPFITINDAMINRKFSKQFPVPIVLGIEEYLEGPLLSYINTLGYVSIGFESGQHDDIKAIENSIAFINLALAYAEVLNIKDDTLKMYFNMLQKASKSSSSFFEIIHLHQIHDGVTFKMKEGYSSFQHIGRGNVLAFQNNSEVKSKYDGRIFMPLYQKRGREGFFIIRPIPKFFLKLSSWLRSFKTDRVLTCFPGVYWHNKKLGVLKANRRVTRFLAKPVFHLLGYRSRKASNNYVYLFNRERVAKNQSYKSASWAK